MLYVTGLKIDPQSYHSQAQIDLDLCLYLSTNREAYHDPRHHRTGA